MINMDEQHWMGLDQEILFLWTILLNTFDVHKNNIILALRPPPQRQFMYIYINIYERWLWESQSRGE